MTKQKLAEIQLLKHPSFSISVICCILAFVAYIFYLPFRSSISEGVLIISRMEPHISLAVTTECWNGKECTCG
jgi:hypothetical protein